MGRTDVSLLSLPLDKAKQLISQGWKFNFHRHDQGLDVWICRAEDSSVYETCNPRDFVELAAWSRECALQARKDNPPIMHALVLRSTNIYSYGYSERSKVLEIRFKDRKTGRKGSLYRYFDVDADTVGLFEAAPSKGMAFDSLIKGVFRYERVIENTGPVRA